MRLALLALTIIALAPPGALAALDWSSGPAQAQEARSVVFDGAAVPSGTVSSNVATLCASVSAAPVPDVPAPAPAAPDVGATMPERVSMPARTAQPAQRAAAPPARGLPALLHRGELLVRVEAPVRHRFARGALRRGSSGGC